MIRRCCSRRWAGSTSRRRSRASARLPARRQEQRAADGGAGCRRRTEDLPAVDGLDTKDGLTRVAGNRKLYLKLLRQFVEQQGPAVGQITAALAQGDTALAERLAHTLKGVAGNIGAKAVQHAAGALEKAHRRERAARGAEARRCSEFAAGRSRTSSAPPPRRAAAPDTAAAPAAPAAGSTRRRPKPVVRADDRAPEQLRSRRPATASRPIGTSFRALLLGARRFARSNKQVGGFRLRRGARRGCKQAAQEKGAAHRMSAAARRESRILVVDDTPANIQTLAAILKEKGYQISVATNGKQALEVLARVQPDLILLDVMMPEMDGFETCRRLKAAEQWRQIPVIFLTAKTETADIVQGFELGAVDYVAKPFNAHELLARVNTHLTMDELRRSLADKNAELARAHELVRRAFGRYVSEEVATSILQSPEGLELGGEEREVTILMSDLRGFTALAARLTPHEVIEFLNLYLEAMVDVISRYEGTIDEIIGDAILVIFGAPLACEDHAAKAVACGLAMQLAMTEVNQRLTAQGRCRTRNGHRHPHRPGDRRQHRLVAPDEIRRGGLEREPRRAH